MWLCMSILNNLIQPYLKCHFNRKHLCVLKIRQETTSENILILDRTKENSWTILNYLWHMPVGNRHEG